MSSRLFRICSRVTRRDFHWKAAVAVAATIVLSGCAGYTLGPTNGLSAGVRSIRIDLFVNKTQEPRLAEPVAIALRRQLQQDGTYKLATHGEADIVVDGMILTYTREPISFNPNDIVITRDYDARLTARVHAIERGTGRVVLDREVTGRTLIQGQSDLPSAERQAVPLLAEDLAHNITALLVDGRW